MPANIAPRDIQITVHNSACPNLLAELYSTSFIARCFETEDDDEEDFLPLNTYTNFDSNPRSMAMATPTNKPNTVQRISSLEEKSNSIIFPITQITQNNI